MKRISLLVICTLLSLPFFADNLFPDGSPIPDWFNQNEIVDINTLGKHYRITDYGVVNDSTLLQTEAIQSVIDQAHQNGGGVIIIPKGVFLSGALFFKPTTHLYLEKDAVLKGDDIIISRFYRQGLRSKHQLFCCAHHADNINGFSISGEHDK